MLSKIKKGILIILVILLCLWITGCEDIEIDTAEQESQTQCNYQYTYGCGFDIMSGSTKCGYGYYYACR